MKVIQEHHFVQCKTTFKHSKVFHLPLDVCKHTFYHLFIIATFKTLCQQAVKWDLNPLPQCHDYFCRLHFIQLTLNKCFDINFTQKAQQSMSDFDNTGTTKSKLPSPFPKVLHQAALLSVFVVTFSQYHHSISFKHHRTGLLYCSSFLKKLF